MHTHANQALAHASMWQLNPTLTITIVPEAGIALWQPLRAVSVQAHTQHAWTKLMAKWKRESMHFISKKHNKITSLSLPFPPLFLCSHGPLSRPRLEAQAAALKAMVKSMKCVVQQPARRFCEHNKYDDFLCNLMHMWPRQTLQVARADTPEKGCVLHHRVSL